MVRVLGSRRWTLGWALAVGAVGLLFCLPLIAMVAGSFRQPGLPPPRTLELIPAARGLDGYRDAFGLVKLARGLLNSVVVSAIAVPLSVVTASWAGFALVHVGRRTRAAVIVALLVVFVVPASALWTTRFVMFRELGLTDTYVPLVAPAILGGSPLFVLLYYLAFRRIPRDVFDAAWLEGAGPLRMWRRIAMPLARPTTVAVGLLSFALFWANFIDPLLYLNTESRFTAPLFLRSLEQLGQTNWPVILAGATVVTLPVVVAFAFALRAISPREGSGWLGG